MSEKIKCGECDRAEGTEKTEWVWCVKKKKLVHKDGSCGAGERRKDGRDGKKEVPDCGGNSKTGQ